MSLVAAAVRLLNDDNLEIFHLAPGGWRLVPLTSSVTDSQGLVAHVWLGTKRA